MLVQLDGMVATPYASRTSPPHNCLEVTVGNVVGGAVGTGATEYVLTMQLAGNTSTASLVVIESSTAVSEVDTKARLAIDEIVDGNVTEVREEHFSNAPAFMIVTDEGITTFFSEEHA